MIKAAEQAGTSLTIAFMILGYLLYRQWRRGGARIKAMEALTPRRATCEYCGTSFTAEPLRCLDVCPMCRKLVECGPAPAGQERYEKDSDVVATWKELNKRIRAGEPPCVEEYLKGIYGNARWLSGQTYVVKTGDVTSIIPSEIIFWAGVCRKDQVIGTTSLKEAVQVMKFTPCIESLILNYEDAVYDEFGNMLPSQVFQSVRVQREVADRINLEHIRDENLLEVIPIRQRIIGDKWQAIIPFSEEDADFVGAIRVEELSPSEFESTIAKLLSKMGLDVEQTKLSGDGGVDVFAEDKTPITGGRYVIQCKRHKGTIGVATIRELYGTMLHEGANKSVLVTTGTFTNGVREFAKSKPIELIDRGELGRLLEEYFPGEYES